MIKNLATGTGLQVSNNYSSWPTFYNTPSSTGNTLIGQMRYNGSSQNIEVYDGSTWMPMTGTYPTIELAGDVQAVVNWARTKMVEEARLKELAARHPIVADAMSAVDRAQEQVRVVAALVEI
jgi:hypothetical protein